MHEILELSGQPIHISNKKHSTDKPQMFAICLKRKMNSPIISTERLNLEKIEERHFENLYSLVSNKEVQRFFPSTLNREEAREFFNKVQRRYKEDGYCFLAVLRKQDGAFLGICGLLKQIIDNKFDIEIGYRFLSEYWGNGYATESVMGCVKYAYEKQIAETLIILSVPENISSIKVAERSGFTYTKKTIFHGLLHHMYRI